MKIGVLGDIHANQEALDAVLAYFEKNGVDSIIHVGDIVGYCSDFARVIDTIREFRIPGVIGNHEQMLLGTLKDERVTDEASAAISWTRARISESHSSFLSSLPQEIVTDDYIVFHACPGDSTYRFSSIERATKVFTKANERWSDWKVAFHGHMHRQQIFSARGGELTLLHQGEGVVPLEADRQYLVCPGSVGISRDSSAKTAYLVYDDRAGFEFGRLRYDWRQRQKVDRSVGLNSRLYRPAKSASRRMRAFLGSLAKKMIGSGGTQ